MDNTYSGGNLEADMAQANATLNQITAFVRESNAKVRGGQEVDLTGLDTRVQNFCEKILAFPQENALAYEVALQQLSEDLVALQQSLEEAQAAVGDELNGVNSHQNATKAYKKADSDQ